MNGDSLGFVATGLMLIQGARWLYLMQRVRIPADRTAHIVASISSALLGVAALYLGTGLAGGVAAVIPIIACLMFLALCAASGQARTTPTIRVGGPVLDFTAHDDGGDAFDLASLRGRPFLLKFFRGHWCPYCVAELRRWNELRPELDARGIEIVTVCADTAEQIRKRRTKHGLAAIMLPDPDLAITDRFNLRNPKGFALKSGVIVPLPIQTTILVDADGIVRWIDQSTDYMVRSEPERVLGAIVAALGDCSRVGERRETPVLVGVETGIRSAAS